MELGVGRGNDWRDRANCIGKDPDYKLFFPLSDTKPEDIKNTEKAKKLCAECPVRSECLGWANYHNIKDGTWGGQTEWERKARPWRPRKELGSSAAALTEKDTTHPVNGRISNPENGQDALGVTGLEV